MRWLFICVASILLGCAGRLPLQAVYEDGPGHRLYLFADRYYIANAGDDHEQFHRRKRWAFGRFRLSADSSLVLGSDWPLTTGATVTQDTSCKHGMCVRVVDERGYTVRPDHIQLIDERDSTLAWSDAYSMFHSDSWSATLVLNDPLGLLTPVTLHFPDSSNHGCQVRLALSGIDLDDRIVLREYKLLRMNNGYIPDGSLSVPRNLDPLFQEFTQVHVSKEDRRWMERRGWNLKRCGHPDRGCRDHWTRLRLGPATIPL